MPAPALEGLWQKLLDAKNAKARRARQQTEPWVLDELAALAFFASKDRHRATASLRPPGHGGDASDRHQPTVSRATP